MSLNNPTLGPVTINGVNYANYGGIISNRVSSLWCTDEDLAFGIGKFQITLRDEDGVMSQIFKPLPSSAYEWSPVSITINNVNLFTGRVEKGGIKRRRGAVDTVDITGYNYGGELANLWVNKDYSANTFINTQAATTLANAMNYKNPQGLGIKDTSFSYISGTPAYPSATTTPGTFSNKYLIDIWREVLTGIGYAARVGLNGVIQLFNPAPFGTNSVAPITGITVTSITPPYQANNNMQDGTSEVDIHELKNYILVKGAGTGFDPNTTALTGTGATWTPSLALQGGGNPISTYIDTPWGATPATTYPRSIIGSSATPYVTSSNQVFTFNFGAGSNLSAYGIIDDTGAGNILNLPFNNKTALHFWAKQTQSPVSLGGLLPGLLWPTFIDNASTTATAYTAGPASVTIPDGTNVTTNFGWTEFNLPLPSPADKIAGGPQNYLYGGVNPGAFNYSSIKVLSLTDYCAKFGGNAQAVKMFGLSDIYFTCIPINFQYDATSMNAYGERDQVVNAGGQYTNQIDLQSYASTVLPTFKNPVLRNTHTLVVDPQVALLKAGYPIQLNWQTAAGTIYGSPQGGSPNGNAQYWRILQVRWDYSSKGFTTKIDVAPCTAG